MKNMKRRKAFTLIELLIVIAIIGLMAGLLMPTISNAMKSVRKSSSKNFMTQLASAIENYKAEYGYYPQFLTEKNRVNLADGSNTENLVKALTGKNIDGTSLSTADRNKYNRRMQKFFEFGNDYLVKMGDSWKVVDAFKNPNIYVCIDTNGIITTGFPTVSDGIPQDLAKDLVKENRIRKNVILFTLKKDASKASGNDFYEAEDVFTWY